MKSSVFHLRPYPGARQQSEQFRRQSVEQALDDATQFVGFFLGPMGLSASHHLSVRDVPPMGQ
jgi:hypothetical protein